MKNNKKGFTLIELIVVIAILAVLAMILVPSLTGYISKSKTSVANANARACYTAGTAALANIESGLSTETKNAAGILNEANTLLGNIEGDCSYTYEGDKLTATWKDDKDPEMTATYPVASK